MEQNRRTKQAMMLQSLKRLLSMSLLGLLLTLLLIYNSFFVFSVPLDPVSPLKSPLDPFLSPPNHHQSLHHHHDQPPSTSRSSSSSDLASSSASASSVLLVVKETKTPEVIQTSPHLLQSQNILSTRRIRRRLKRREDLTTSAMAQGRSRKRFRTRVKSFLSKSSCDLRFFMTWISSIESFGDRERFTIESLFKFHPNSCLILISNSLDSDKGSLILKPFTDKRFKVIAIKPDFDYIFKDTSAERWFQGLKKGRISPGVIPLEQNLSNLLRLVLLYKFGGIYLDTDVIILKSFSNLHNVIGAQTIDSATRKWSRLNNAVLIFDKNHPLLKRFINEFSRTFNGNKWGHNGPYLVSRVVARIKTSSSSSSALGFSVLPPSAFYPVDWTRIRGFYRAPANGTEAKWSQKRLEHVQRHSFAVHLWNRESKKLKIEQGSIIHHLITDSCIFCNSSNLLLS